MFDKEFINNFSTLGLRLLNWANCISSEPLIESAITQSEKLNPLFTPYMQRNSIVTIARFFLDSDVLVQWISKYNLNGDNKISGNNKNILVVCAGNIPAVGFHDIMCVLASGNNAVVKLSSKDKFLLPAILDILVRINSRWEEKIKFIYSLQDVSSVVDGGIAMGSNEAVAALEIGFPNIDKLLRGHMFSYAIINGDESDEQLRMLSYDMLLYFGLGCRSVSYLLVPTNYDFSRLIEACEQLRTLLDVNCYKNSYKRERAIAIMNGDCFIDGGFFLLKYTFDIDNNQSVIGVREYVCGEDLDSFEKENYNIIQKKYRTFGNAQTPKPCEYPNGIDTMEFILKLKN